MRCTFRQTALFVCLFGCLFFAGVVAGKSVIRELLDPRQLAPSKDRPNRHPEDVPIERCRVAQNKELSGKLDRLCDECFQTYRVANFYMQCRAECFDNDIFRGCAMAMFRQALVSDFERFLDTEVAVKGNTIPPIIEETVVSKGDSL